MLKQHDNVKSAYAELNMVKLDSEHENLYEQKWDKVNLAYKDFLFSVSINITFQLIAHVEPETYSGLYDIYKKKTAMNGSKKWNNYTINTININEEMLRQVTAYEPSKK